MSDKGKPSKLAFLIEKYGSLNCLKYFSALLGLKENHILQPLIERWLNEILERLDIPKINKLSIDSHTMFQNLVEELYKESKEDVKLWTSIKNKEVQIELDAFAPVGRNGQLYRTYFDFFDGSTYQIGEVLQFLGILIENFSEKEYKAKFNQFLTRIYTLVDQIHRKHQKLIKESKKELVKVKDVYIPNIEFINHWFSLVTLNYKKNDWIKVIDPLIITIENNSLDYDRRRVDDYLAVQIKDELMFFSPFRVYRCLFKFFISEFYSEFSKNEEIEKSVYEYIFNYLFSLLYNLEHFNLVIPFPKVVNKKGEVISSADIGVISDSTKFILINLVNPIESNYLAIDTKTIKPKGGDFNSGKCPSIKDDLKLVWNQEDGKVEEIEIGQIRNSEIFSIFISGLLITDVEIKEKRLPLSFSLYEFKIILSETNSVTFPLFLRARKFAPLYVDHILYFKDELDFFEYSKASFYDFITRDTDFLYLFMNWDMEDWKRRTTRVFQLNPTNLKPIIPFIMQMIEINEFTYQIGYRNQFDKSWVIDISPFKLFISFDQLDYYSELMFLIRVIFNYFSKFNDRIVKLLKENINKNQKTKDFSIEISISDRLTKNIVFCQKGGEKKNKISSFVLKIDFGRIVNRKKRRNLNFEVELIGSIISLLIYNKCFNNNIDSEIKDFISRLTNHKQIFFLTKTYHRGRPPSLEYRPHELPQWVKIRTDNEIARIIRKKRTYPKEITGKELSSFYREISNILQKRVEQIIFKLPKKFLLANFLLELDFLQEKREFDSIQLGYSMKKGVLEDDISDLSKTMNELSIMSISLRHAIETTLSTNNNQSPSFQPNFELYFSIIELCCRRLIYASKSDEIFFNLLDESITIDSKGYITILQSHRKIKLSKFKETFTRIKFQRIIEDVQKRGRKDDETRLNETKTSKQLALLSKKVNEDFKLEFGLTVGDLHNIYENILLYLDEKDNVTILPENELINIIQSTERMDRKFTDAEIKNFFENFILESIKHEEIEPWKVRSRKNRLVFKPIIRIDESYLLSIRLIEISQKMIDAILIEGIFPISLRRVKNEELKNSVEKLRRRITNLFEKDVKDLTKGFFPIVEESALKNPGRIWGIPNFLNTQIDILGICPKNKIIAIIEVKDFGLTLDVREIKREIKNFTTKDGYFEKNSKRCEEVNKYLKKILMYYNQNYDPKYQILGIFVLKDVKMTGFVINTDQKVFSYEEYNEWLREVVN